jgi:predicted HNH restriction endonuclease
MQRNCLKCGLILKTRYKIKFCSNKCQQQFRFERFISKWKMGEVQGSIGITTKTLSRHIHRYLIEKRGAKCELCGWNKINTVTGKIPLEVHHSDGNSENNKEENLKLICPNCHSLTPHFRNLNIGHGRKWRTMKNSVQKT